MSGRFLTRELSRMLGLPFSTYWFKYGDDASSYYAYTDAGEAFTAPGSLAAETVTYTPIPILRENIVATGTLDKQQIAISMPRDIPLVDLFIAYPPSQVVQCVIREGHVGVTDQVPVAWAGRVLSVTLEGSTAKFAVEPITTSMRRNGLRRNWMIGCPLALYGTSCRADKVAATTTVTLATNPSGSTVIMPGGWEPRAMVKYVGGMIQWSDNSGNTIVRTILTYSGENLVVAGSLPDLAAGKVVAVSLGCGHTQDDCLNLHVEVGTGHTNILNYGGQDWIPIKNPVNKDQNYFG